jgi:hypothetical protein
MPPFGMGSVSLPKVIDELLVAASTIFRVVDG